jgi:hypothetical protein
MHCSCATRNRHTLQTGRGATRRWYVPGALWEETARPTRALAVAVIAVLSIAVSACGNDKPRQDANEPEGNFPLAVSAAKFPTDQRLAQTSDLRLEIENSGDKQVPNLAVTIWTGDDKGGGGSFDIASDQPGLADPNRPVWILESGYPKLATSSDESATDLDAAPTSGADVAETDTFAFGPLDAGDSRDIVWRVTPVQPGTYTLHYELAAGLTGKAKAVGEDGSPVEGEFAVTITDKPARATVDSSGQVQIQNP